MGERSAEFLRIQVPKFLHHPRHLFYNFIAALYPRMLRKILPLLLLLACSFSSIAQVSVRDSIKVFQQLDSVYTEEAENASPKISDIVARQDKIAQLLNMDSLKVKVLMNRGQMLEIAGITEGAMKAYFDALKIALKAGEHWYAARLYYNIGLLYQGLNDIEHSTAYYHNSKQELTAGNKFIDTISLNYEIGFNMAVGGNVAGGMAVLKQNLAAAKKAGREDDIILGLDNICNVYGEIGEYDTALKYLLEIYKYPEGVESNYRKAVVNEHVAEVYARLKQWAKAQRYLDTSLHYAELINSRDWKVEGYRLQATIYENTGQPAKALAAHKLYSQLHDSMYSASYANKATLLSSVHDLERKQAQIALLQKTNQLNASKLEQRQFREKVWAGGGLLALAIAGMGAFAWFQRRIKNMQVDFSRLLLQAQETEKQRISKELHDSIGQNILFVKNQLARGDVDIPRISETIAHTIDDVRNISKDLYPNQLDKYGLAASVDALAEKVQAATGIFLSADLEEIDTLLDKQARISLYRIIQEAVNNVVKHAGAKAIRVTGSVVKNKVTLMIMDNGRGFDTSAMESKASRSFGLLNMEERTRMLNGRFALQSNSEGTKITVTIPL
jgi:signal transduction histidine kinase